MYQNSKTTQNKICGDCGLSSLHHINTWIEGLLEPIFPFFGKIQTLKKLEKITNIFFEKFFTFFKIASIKDYSPKDNIAPRSKCFIEEGIKHGLKFKVIHGPFGPTNNFQMIKNGKIRRFTGLPLAEFKSKWSPAIVDDKKFVKKILKRGGLPVAEGKSFWFFQKNKALKYGKHLGFPLVVKPRGGSVSRHVTLDITNEASLKTAINCAIKYSPSFIVEKFIANTFVHRITIIDFDFIAIAKEEPANILGDGVSQIRALIDKKNEKLLNAGLHKIVENEITEKLLKEQGYDFSSTPKKNEKIYLQKDPFVRLGADIIEMTPEIHSENLKLFRDIAKIFDIKVVGIDFLAKDISIPYHMQNCAILELNSLPAIEIHHFPSVGKPENPASALVKMVLKYYF